MTDPMKIDNTDGVKIMSDPMKIDNTDGGKLERENVNDKKVVGKTSDNKPAKKRITPVAIN